MQLNVIHIKSRKDRLQLLEYQLSERNIERYKIWDGVEHENPKKGIANAHKIIYGNINLDNTVNDFSGLHFYKIKNNFYDTFLSTAEAKDIDRSLANKGKYIVCNPFSAIQHNGSLQMKNIS